MQIMNMSNVNKANNIKNSASTRNSTNINDDGGGGGGDDDDDDATKLQTKHGS
jgi:hypothetical protein